MAKKINTPQTLLSLMQYVSLRVLGFVKHHLGTDLLKQGIRWRVGDGNNVKIWTDPCSNDFKPFKGQTPVNLELRVNALIDQQNHIWNSHGLHNYFCPNDINTIWSSSLSITETSGKIMSHYTKSGNTKLDLQVII